MSRNYYKITRRILAIYDGQTPIIGGDSRRRTLVLTAVGTFPNIAFAPYAVLSREDCIIRMDAAEDYQVLTYADWGEVITGEWYCFSGATACYINTTEVYLQPNR